MFNSKYLLCNLLVISIIVVISTSGCVQQGSNPPTVDSENCKGYCPPEKFSAWTEFSEKPIFKQFELNLPKSRFESQGVSTRDCWQELQRQTGISQTEICSICKITQVSGFNDKIVNCECYYGEC